MKYSLSYFKAARKSAVAGYKWRFWWCLAFIFLELLLLAYGIHERIWLTIVISGSAVCFFSYTLFNNKRIYWQENKSRFRSLELALKHRERK